uniref:Uncharacterized protein n=1 Tax=Plectus sambesii TaxID=2011161 RepID=A0A914W510_9BILA
MNYACALRRAVGGRSRLTVNDQPTTSLPRQRQHTRANDRPTSPVRPYRPALHPPAYESTAYHNFPQRPLVAATVNYDKVWQYPNVSYATKRSQIRKDIIARESLIIRQSLVHR